MSKEEIKFYLNEYLKNKFDVDEYEIDNKILSLYMDSLDIVDFIVEIEHHFGIVVDECQWEDMFINDIVVYIENKLNRYGE